MTGMPASIGAGDRLGQRLGFLGADDQKIDLRADEFLDVRRAG